MLLLLLMLLLGLLHHQLHHVGGIVWVYDVGEHDGFDLHLLLAIVEEPVGTEVEQLQWLLLGLGW